MFPRVIWVTGAAGSIGSALTASLTEETDTVLTTDLDVDVTDRGAVDRFVRKHQPTLVFHCAGAKHAPDGEDDPGQVAWVNVQGTRNIIDSVYGRVVLASTCKAADPETAYGASKLIAERMVLNVGGVVARFYNVRQTSGNVFEIWKNTDGPIDVTPCWRYFIDLDQAVDLIRKCAVLPTGRYTVDPGESVFMPDLADELYPDRERRLVPPRRGDRVREPLHAACERLDKQVSGMIRITSPHDPEVVVAHPETVPFDMGTRRTPRIVSPMA